ncbi:1105_t:CDS:2 [Diversispora eburnea]|uniref:1105_t:CDS:1 n=1 Tax=Diversispora eburnea TaxID=1213867 RepID=A0A9N9CAV4_9GLOM|nr:1105_t:CDS:2 [Diversispora eburnea]
MLIGSIAQIEQETSQNATTITTECHNSSHIQTSTQNHTVEMKSLKLDNFDLSSTYDRFVRPYKEKGMDPTSFPYIDKLPGKMKIVADKSLRKLVNKSSKRKKWNEKYPPEKYPLDSKTIECNMLNLLRPGIIPGFDPAEYGLVDGLVDVLKKKHKNEFDYEGERRRKHKQDKERKTNGKDGEYKKKKRKM